MRFYFAGKIDKNCWRHQIVGGLRDSYLPERRVHAIRISEYGDDIYVGPFFIGCDHGCFHGEDTHGLGVDVGGCYDGVSFTQHETKDLCLRQINSADVIFCWLDDDTAYGTLVELGYAKALNKKIIIASQRMGALQDLWFAFATADHIIHAKDPLTAWEKTLRKIRQMAQLR